MLNVTVTGIHGFREMLDILMMSGADLPYTSHQTFIEDEAGNERAPFQFFLSDEDIEAILEEQNTADRFLGGVIVHAMLATDNREFMMLFGSGWVNYRHLRDFLYEPDDKAWQSRYHSLPQHDRIEYKRFVEELPYAHEFGLVPED